MGKRNDNYFGYDLEPGDVTKSLNVSLELASMGEVDLMDAEAVSRRLGDYFAIYSQADMKPTFTGMALALNISTQKLRRIRNGADGSVKNVSAEATHVIQQAATVLELQWETYMQNGKIHPVAGIFLGKNNFGYSDRTEIGVDVDTVVTLPSADDIRKRYLTSGEEDLIEVGDDDEDE